ncbi:MAG: iron-sulfur cluster insertion protein ErpA [Anaerolineales bacterium]|nr:iron-sulfur cluster insertion protein ErpA [Anaerolineales bacterium]
MALPETKIDEITLTDPAAEAVRNLLSQRDLSAEDYALRVFIAGGGCSGYQYGMALEAEVRDTDFLFSHGDVRVVIDEVSIDYLKGANIDYVDDVMGSGFKIDNPNAVSACGCGQSFRTSGDEAPQENTGGCSSCH